MRTILQLTVLFAILYGAPINFICAPEVEAVTVQDTVIYKSLTRVAHDSTEWKFLYQETPASTDLMIPIFNVIDESFSTQLQEGYEYLDMEENELSGDMSYTTVFTPALVRFRTSSKSHSGSWNIKYTFKASGIPQ